VAHETLRDCARAVAQMTVIWHCEIFDTTPASRWATTCVMTHLAEIVLGGFLKKCQRVQQQGWAVPPPQLEKKSKYTKTENSVTADHELLPEQQNTTDY